jgi:RHS repeat-associated protein
MGDRLASSQGSGFVWVIADLHGNVAAQCGSTGSITDVFRYDAYGKAIGTSLPNSPVASPWRFGGRILESTAGADVYDAGARSYVPDLGTFTSLDTVAGSAQNPLTLNRFLYANANPATLVDPSGHSACYSGYCPLDIQEEAAQNERSKANIAAGCPVQYCGTRDQKARNAGLDIAITKAIKESEAKQQQVQDAVASRWAGTKANSQAAAQADSLAASRQAAQHRDCGFMNVGCFDAGAAWNNVTSTAAGAANTVNQTWQHSGGALVNSASDMKDWALSHQQETIFIVLATIVVVGTCELSCPALLSAAFAAGGGDLALACAVGCTAAASIAVPVANLSATVWNASNIDNPSKQIDVAALVGIDLPTMPYETPARPRTPYTYPHVLTDWNVPGMDVDNPYPYVSTDWAVPGEP